jgi:hypothetical protein
MQTTLLGLAHPNVTTSVQGAGAGRTDRHKPVLLLSDVPAFVSTMATNTSELHVFLFIFSLLNSLLRFSPVSYKAVQGPKDYIN